MREHLASFVFYENTLRKIRGQWKLKIFLHDNSILVYTLFGHFSLIRDETSPLKIVFCLRLIDFGLYHRPLCCVYCRTLPLVFPSYPQFLFSFSVLTFFRMESATVLASFADSFMSLGVFGTSIVARLWILRTGLQGLQKDLPGYFRTFLLSTPISSLFNHALYNLNNPFFTYQLFSYFVKKVYSPNLSFFPNPQRCCQVWKKNWYELRIRALIAQSWPEHMYFSQSKLYNGLPTDWYSCWLHCFRLFEPDHDKPVVVVTTRRAID